MQTEKWREKTMENKMENKKKLFDIRYKVKIYNVHVESPR